MRKKQVSGRGPKITFFIFEAWERSHFITIQHILQLKKVDFMRERAFGNASFIGVSGRQRQKS